MSSSVDVLHREGEKWGAGSVLVGFQFTWAHAPTLICAYMRQWYMLTVLHNAPVPHFTSGSFLRAIESAYTVSFSGIPAPPPTSQCGNPAYRCGPTGLCSSCFQYSVWPRILMAHGVAECPYILSFAVFLPRLHGASHCAPAPLKHGSSLIRAAEHSFCASCRGRLLAATIHLVVRQLSTGYHTFIQCLLLALPF